MKQIVVSLLLLTSFGHAFANDLNQLSEYEQRSGWKLLFDGRSTSGWRSYRAEKPHPLWSVEEGVLTGRPGAGDLITRETYDHFELTLDYKISAGGNSGVLFHVTEAGKKAWHSGPEVQLLDNARHRAKQKSGWLYGLYQPEIPAWSLRARAAAGIDAPVDVDATRPAGAWNQVYLRVARSGCEVAINGVSYYRFTMGDREWKRRVAASKFAKYPEFGKAGRGHITLQEHGQVIAFRNLKIRSLTAEGEPPQQPIDGKLKLQGELAFPQLHWQDWSPIDEEGRTQPLRILELIDDGGARLYAADQRGRIYRFPNRRDAAQAELILDIRDRVAPWREHNEEGLLGLALHPDFRKNGRLFVYYSSQQAARTSIVSRFDADPKTGNVDKDSETVLLRLKQPFHNHNGGSMAFGPQGHLYIALGDGGDRNDPFGHGQNLATWMGAILRIDVNSPPTAGRPYAIPADNPFVHVADARPEIYAFGFRNVWRMAFDRTTGDLWAADVGQDLWEEINLVRRGGNYGWNVREGRHPFGNKTLSSSSPLEPVWEYDHRIGKSITGGRVYRSNRLPELTGKYLYADYVSGRIWALQRDASGNVASNEEISAGGIPVLAFGEDDQGEVYYMTAAASGKNIFRLVRPSP